MEDFGRTYDDSYADLIEQGATKVILADGLELELRPMPDESREHALDPRVFELTRKRLGGEFITPSGMDFEAMRNRPNKENHNIDSGDVIETVETMELDGRKVALYVFTPAGLEEPAPVLAYFHGGGFMVGNIGQFRPALRYIAEQAGVVVVFPDYRLAPENKFPAGVNDCNETIDYLAEHAERLHIDMNRCCGPASSWNGYSQACSRNVSLRGLRSHPRSMVIRSLSHAARTGARGTQSCRPNQKLIRRARGNLYRG